MFNSEEYKVVEGRVLNLKSILEKPHGCSDFDTYFTELAAYCLCKPHDKEDFKREQQIIKWACEYPSSEPLDWLVNNNLIKKVIPKPRRCPFCCSRKVIEKYRNNNEYRVVCESCFACGPRTGSIETAIRAWNSGRIL
jgi:hypothetical protein